MSWKKILLLVLVLVGAVFGIRQLLVDSSAIHVAEGVHWHNRTYLSMGTHPAYETEGMQFVAKDDQGYGLYRLAHDTEINYLYISSFLDNYLLRDEAFYPPVSGKITAVYVNNRRVSGDSSASDLVSALSKLSGHDSACLFTSVNDLLKIQVSFDKSLVSAKDIGYIGHDDVQWFFIKNIEPASYKNLYHDKPTTLSCIKMDPETVELIKGIPEFKN